MKGWTLSSTWSGSYTSQTRIDRRFTGTSGWRDKFGEVREVAEEGGSGHNNLSKVLPCGVPGGATPWVVNLGVDSSGATKT